MTEEIKPIKYHKIENLFAREEGTFKLLTDKYKRPEVEYLKDLPWFFTEKLDGTNIRIFWDGYRVSIHGRTDNAILPPHLNEYLKAKFLTKECEQMFEQKYNQTPVMLIGEGVGPKIQKGGHLYFSEPRFVLFDVLIANRYYVPRLKMYYIAGYFDVILTRHMFTGSIEAAIELVRSNPTSPIAKQERPIEGLVGVPKTELLDSYGNRLIVKILTSDFGHNKELL